MHPAPGSLDRPSYASLVANVDSDTAKYIAECRVQTARQEMIGSPDDADPALQSMAKVWLRATTELRELPLITFVRRKCWRCTWVTARWWKNKQIKHRNVSSSIVVRHFWSDFFIACLTSCIDGVSEGQFAQVLAQELPQLQGITFAAILSHIDFLRPDTQPPVKNSRFARTSRLLWLESAIMYASFPARATKRTRVAIAERAPWSIRRSRIHWSSISICSRMRGCSERRAQHTITSSTMTMTSAPMPYRSCLLRFATSMPAALGLSLSPPQSTVSPFSLKHPLWTFAHTKARCGHRVQ